MTEASPEALVTSNQVLSPNGRLHVSDRSGVDPALVLMHGFPDDSRIYDRLTPLLGPRRVVIFDFAGYGRSERTDPDVLESGDHADDLGVVLDALDLADVSLVAHDASGPIAIDYAVRHADRVSQLILLDTYYGHASTLRLPEMIRLLADHHFAPLADAMLDDPNQRLWLLQHTARRFGGDPNDPSGVEVTSVLPQFFGDGTTPDALVAIREWTGALFADLDRQDEAISEGRVAALDLPVTLLFGARDEYLNPDLARHLAGLFPRANVRIVEGAAHWPQWDQPETVARLIREAASRQ
jgi:pimeloyl-ACP methyl ester carboxylesterase